MCQYTSQFHYTKRNRFMPFLLAEILNFQGSTHQYGVGSFSYLPLKVPYQVPPRLFYSHIFSAAVSIVFTAAILFHFLKDCTQYSKTGKCMPSNQLTFPCRILHSCKITFLFHYTFLPEIAALTNFYNRSHPFF